MNFHELAGALGATLDESGWMLLTRQLGGRVHSFFVQPLYVDAWALALVQLPIGQAPLGAAEAVARLAPFPLGALVRGDAGWVLRHALDLDALTVERLELAFACLAYIAREIVAAPSHPSPQIFAHYLE